MHMKRSFSTLVAFVFVLGSFAQVDSVRMRYARTITAQDLRQHLEVLASDAYEGREAGMPGQKMAAEYLKEQFASFGIGPVPEPYADALNEGYFQRFDLEVKQPGGIDLEVDGRTYAFMKDLVYFSERLTDPISASTIWFAGNGGAGNYVDRNMSNAVVLALGGAQDGGDERSVFVEMTAKSKAAEKAGAAVLLIVTPDLGSITDRFGHYLTTGRMRLAGAAEEERKAQLQTILISEELGSVLLKQGRMSMRKARKKAAEKARELDCTVSIRNAPRLEHLSSENVLGYVEGGDLKDEVIVVTAHYDHIGAHDGEVYNGADDDGSGTVALLEMAQAFAEAKANGHGPRRSVLFMPVSAEEKGLLGSEYYSENPVFPLERTVADLNIDMIGRTDSIHADAEPYVYIIGSDRLSSELHAINAEMNERYVQLDLDETFNATDDPNRFYYRSDHYNFARKGVPVIFYFSGVHEDYHQPGDEVQKIRFDLLERRTMLVFHTAWELANRDARIVVDKPIEAE